MTVKELKEVLENLNDDSLVVMSSDGEGNAYHELEDYQLEMIYDSTNHEIGYPKLTLELIEEGYEEGDIIYDGVPCVVFYP